MTRLLLTVVVALSIEGCSSHTIKVSGEALSVKTDVPEHAHVQVNGQCLTCLRHACEFLTDECCSLDPEISRYQEFATQNARRMVEKLTAPAATPANE